MTHKSKRFWCITKFLPLYVVCFTLNFYSCSYTKVVPSKGTYLRQFCREPRKLQEKCGTNCVCHAFNWEWVKFSAKPTGPVWNVISVRIQCPKTPLLYVQGFWMFVQVSVEWPTVRMSCKSGIHGLHKTNRTNVCLEDHLPLKTKHSLWRWHFCYRNKISASKEHSLMEKK